MQFLNAGFLWAGFAVLIPLVIHLFNFRRYKTVYFSDVRFLRNLKNITRQRSVLKQILLMVLRMLIIACLVFAFSEPVISDKNSAGKGLGTLKNAPPVIYIDNSFSMQAGKIEGLNLENAKNKALEIALAFPAGTRFLFITNDFSQEHNRLVTAEGLRLFLQELKVSPNAPETGRVIEKALQNLNFQDIDKNTLKNVFVISDFQKNVCDFSDLQYDSLLTIHLAAVESEAQNNVSVDTVEFPTPYRLGGSEEEALVTVRNYGAQPAKNVPLKLFTGGNCKCATTVDLNPYEKKQVSLKYANSGGSLVKGRISVEDFPVSYDNDLYFTYAADSLKKILVVGEGGALKYFSALFSKDKNFQLEVSEPENVADLTDYQTVIINMTEKLPRQLSGRIQTFVSSGGNVVFVPSFTGNRDDYNYLLSLMECNALTQPDTLRCRISKFNAESPLLKTAIKSVPENVDLPVITRYFNSASNSYKSQETILETDSYKKILTANEYGSGMFYVFYTSLDDKSGTLVTHRLIVPLLYNAAAFSKNYGRQYYSVIGSDGGFTAKISGYREGVKVFLKAEDSGFEFIPRISGPDGQMNFKIFSQNCVEKAGFYNLTADGRNTGISVAYNYDRKESDLDFFTAEEVLKKLSARGFQSVRVIDAREGGTFQAEDVQSAANKPLWKIFVICAIFFAIIEIFICRFV